MVYRCGFSRFKLKRPCLLFVLLLFLFKRFSIVLHLKSKVETQVSDWLLKSHNYREWNTEPETDNNGIRFYFQYRFLKISFSLFYNPALENFQYRKSVFSVLTDESWKCMCRKILVVLIQYINERSSEQFGQNKWVNIIEKRIMELPNTFNKIKKLLLL